MQQSGMGGNVPPNSQIWDDAFYYALDTKSTNFQQKNHRTQGRGMPQICL